MRKIDAFAHILPPSYARRLEPIVSGAGASDRILGFQPWIHEDPALIDLDARWRAVDPFGDYVQVLTLAVPPIDQLGEPGLARDLARAANDELAELVGRYPDRFAGFAAALPMNDVDAAVAEIGRAMGELGALGAQLHTNVGGAPLDDPRFEPVFETVARLGGALWIHPTRSEVWPDYPAESRSKYGIWWSLGWPYETSVCMTRLVYSPCPCHRAVRRVHGPGVLIGLRDPAGRRRDQRFGQGRRRRLAALGADRRGRRVRARLDRVQLRQGDPRRGIAVRLRDPRARLRDRGEPGRGDPA